MVLYILPHIFKITVKLISNTKEKQWEMLQSLGILSFLMNYTGIPLLYSTVNQVSVARNIQIGLKLKYKQR